MVRVDLDGPCVEVEPIAEMSPVRAMTASVIMARYSSALDRDDPVSAEDAATDLLAYCTDGVQQETIRTLGPDHIERLYDVILPDESEVDQRP